MNILHVHNRSEMRQSVEIRMHNRRQPMEYTRAAGRSSFLIVRPIGLRLLSLCENFSKVFGRTETNGSLLLRSFMINNV